MKNKVIFLLLAIITLFACKKEDEDIQSESGVAPIVQFLSPLDDVYLTKGDSLKIIAHASDNDGVISCVAIYSNNQLVFIDSVNPYEHTMFFNQVGTYAIRLKAIDDDNLYSLSDTVNIFVLDLVKPTVSFNYNPHWQIIENDNVEVNISASSPHGDIRKTSLYVDDMLYKIDSTAPFQIIWDSVPAGNHILHATAEDIIGEIGISTNYFITVLPNTIPTVEFIFPNYNYSKFVPGERIRIYITAYDSDGSIKKLEVYANDSLIKTLIEEREFYWEGAVSGEYILTVKAYDDNGGIALSEGVNITVLPGIITDGIISDLEYSENDELVFGLNQTTNKLLLINPQNGTLTKTDLPFSQPISMDYSLDDQKLYIVYKFSGTISVWDSKSQSLSSIDFSGSSDGRVIKIDPQNRRIYVLSNSGLFILNMDTGNVLLSNVSIVGESMALDPDNMLLFTAKEGGSPAKIYKYSVSSDVLTLLQTNNNCGSNPRKISMNPNNDFVVLPCGGGNGGGYTVYAYDTDNLNNVLGEFDIGTYPLYASFTPNGQKMLGTNGDPYDEYLYVMNSYSFIEDDKKYFPNSDNYCRITTNYSGTKIIAFSYDDHYDNEYVIYFFNL